MDRARDDDADFARRLKLGDNAALASLFDRHGAVAYRLALSVTRDAELAEDAVQDAFLGVWRGIARFDPLRASFKTWLLTVVHRRAIDIVRRRRPVSALPQDLMPEMLRSSDALSETLTRLDAVSVRTALDELPDRQREAVSLAYFGGLTQTEIAAATGAPLGTVKSRVRLGLLAMRARLTSRGSMELPLPRPVSLAS